MDGAERRARERCPVCQGPMKKNDSGGDRCRNSLCAYNHRQVICPRCQSAGPEATQHEAAQLQYFCQECQYKWKVAQ